MFPMKLIQFKVLTECEVESISHNGVGLKGKSNDDQSISHSSLNETETTA